MSESQNNYQVSVLLPTLNDADYIEKCIQSVLKQTYSDFEVIILDGGSTDGTIEYVNSVSDSRISLVHSKGIVQSLNRGIKEADGEYIARVDADTVSHPKRFERQVEFLNSNPEVAAVGTAVKRIYPSTRESWSDRKPTTHREIEKKLIDASALVHPAVMMRRSLVEKVGGYRDYRWEDYELWTRLLQFRLANIDKELVTVYQRENSVQGNTSPIQSILSNTVCGLLAITRSSFPVRRKLMLYAILLPKFIKKISYKYLYQDEQRG
ncbi:hypothetical protein BRC91_01780 [Halobacteriales archaeon QS_4_62_28]|nr:MAG: hypothetical protein BRC91_01780 [Halobacteriales archaeon QS_4_62_28]